VSALAAAIVLAQSIDRIERKRGGKTTRAICVSKSVALAAQGKIVLLY
jgi:flagellar biogenesis protein FliO